MLTSGATGSRVALVTAALAAILSSGGMAEAAAPGGGVSTDPGVQSSMASVAIVLTDTGTGTAFAVSADTLVTAEHVVHGANKVAVRLDGRVQEVQIVSTSTRLDLATLHLSGDRMKPLTFQAAPAQLGQTVYAAGAALGGDLSLTRGIVSGHRDEAGFAHVLTDAAINPGNSGGPLLDDSGTVLGVVVSKLGNAEGMALAVSAADVSGFLHDLPVMTPSPGVDGTAAAKPKPATASSGHAWPVAWLWLLPGLGLTWLIVSRPRPLRIKLTPPKPAKTDNAPSPSNKGIPWRP